jgi:uncharacterized protein
MSQARLHKPLLYRLKGTDALPNHPALLGTRCTCGHTHFPPHHYGCEQCGRHGAALTDVALNGRGELVSVATVHLHNAAITDDDVLPIAAPFTIVTVALDDGPRVRGLLAEGAQDIEPGTTVVTSMMDIGRNGVTVLDLRFSPED